MASLSPNRPAGTKDSFGSPTCTGLTSCASTCLGGRRGWWTCPSRPRAPARWHEGFLWISDMHGPYVLRIDLSGRPERVVDVPESPSGLGWLPDGRLLVV